MNTNMTIQVNPADNLRKLNDLLAVLGQSMRDGTSPSEEIETCIGIAWDLGNSAYNRILTQSQINQPAAPTDYIPYNIGNRIQIAREKLDMSLDDLAAAVLPDDVEVISEWENSKSEPCASEIIRLSQALKCDPMWLLTGEGNNANQVTPVNVMKGADLANIGVRIKNRRNETGMGADKLADAIDVPIHQIYQWEEGKVIPHSGYYCRLAKALNTSMSWLMTGKDISGEFKNQHDENIPSSDLTNL
ncbi:TPA: helix-turn-helix domain-containing protein [Salmonella enterica subsp. enterica serovar Muenchen]|nr:helix-turn-helix domain-containing protein [Salmonella enterica subsp. enterica serovar Java]